MHIGICDDGREVRQLVFDLCETYFGQKLIKHSYTNFTSGEEVLEYCKKKDNKRMDLLFLDIEMDGISGIELKDLVLRDEMVWRIAFVSSHMENSLDAYGIKTIGFIPKPPSYENIKKMLEVTMSELNENAIITIKDHNGNVIEVALEDIVYLKADGSYTEIYIRQVGTYKNDYILCTKKLGELERELKDFPFVRVHKSYLVNLQNALEISSHVTLRDRMEQIPVGRSYKEEAKRKFYAYGKNRIRKRL